MRYPIFSDDTLFLNQTDAHQFSYHRGKSSVVFPDGTKIARLKHPQPLVEVTTKRGNTLRMSPETAFALAKDDNGALIRYLPQPDYAAVLSQKWDWSDALDDTTSRSYFLAGAIIGNGNHILNRNRASFFVCSDKILIDSVEKFLERLGQKFLNEKRFHKYSARVKITPISSLYLIKSRIVTLLVKDLIGEKTLTLSFDPSNIELMNLHAFARGVFATTERTEDGYVIRHRSSKVVRQLHAAFMYRLGIRCDCYINPMEPEVMSQAPKTDCHRILITGDQIQSLMDIGVIDGDQINAVKPQADQIMTVKPLSVLKRAVVVIPGEESNKFPLTANGFAFSATFDVPDPLMDIAAHPVLVDSSDPLQFEG